MSPFETQTRKATAQGLLWRPEFERDSCGVGFVANLSGKRSVQPLRMAITSVCNLMHRGAVDADAKTGDGAGVLTQIPYKLFARDLAKMGQKLFNDTDLGVGVFFFPRENAYHLAQCKAIIEDVLKKRALFLFGWRRVPTDKSVLGDKALATLPEIEQALIGRPAGQSDEAYERALFLARKEIERRILEASIPNFYACSMSHRTIVYKGLMVSVQLDRFYKDLRSTDFETSFCVFHQRYSTNTFPTWALSQPFRRLGHNGEINTISGNRNWMAARTPELASPLYNWDDLRQLHPISQPGSSDSGSLDNALETLTLSGRDLLHAILMLAPSAWRTEPHVDESVKSFYEYHNCIMEPWDGPAALVFADGNVVGACLDRNGLRPARYKITSDGFILMGSEVGTIEVPDSKVIEKGRLGPGQIIAVDLLKGKLLRNDEIKETYATRKPYAEWVKNNLVRLNDMPLANFKPQTPEPIEGVDLVLQQLSFGYTSEEVNLVIKPMIETGKEAVGSMGDDAPLAVLSRQPRLLYSYFKQLFAQVTNPPIDPIREELVMSLSTFVGYQQNLFAENEDHARLVEISSPVLSDADLAALRQLEWLADSTGSKPSVPAAKAFSSKTLPCLIFKSDGPEALEKALLHLCAEAERAVDAKRRILILSDRGVDCNRIAIPMLIATAAVHHHLIRAGKRMQVGIICETAEARDVHQFACLLGYGASAINPYLALATIRHLCEQQDAKESGETNGESVGKRFLTAFKNYRKSLDDGILKIMSKMGISTLSSYRGAQIFEAIGVHPTVCDLHFTGTVSRVGGISFKEIAQESFARHALGYGLADLPAAESSGPAPTLQDPGYYRFRQKGEMHAFTPPVIKSFHAFVKTGTPEGYKAYVAALEDQQPLALRHLLKFKQVNEPISIDEVEPVEEIRRRFTTAGMSLGALSPEAHEALAIAMNRIGGKSNSGEGGEDAARFHVRPNGDWANSAIKQVASGRFGVTAEYLASAKEIEIKMAQGSKPGEGGQLPGHKVSPLIARLRRSVPGVTLISPPPHHDIYSIEDLAQLIYDLKQANPRAKVCVKLVAEAGVGTIAAGVAKAYADIVLISGHDGGTGASPLSSIKNAGSSWELGIAEAQQTLVLNDLRGRITLRADGGMRNGRDIVIAALLGAEEYNFGTTALIAAGCVYVRQCHLNTCPVGVATQDERLRAKFKGSPDMIVNFFNGVAQEVREIMASLGVRTLNELIGRTEHLEQREIPNHPKANTLDLRALLAQPDNERSARYHIRERNDRLDKPLDDTILQDAKDAIGGLQPVVLKYGVKNTNRSVGTKLSGEIAYRYGDKGLPPSSVELRLKGTAGQSLGAFLCNGVRIHLTGESNDYVGKGMSGGEIIVVPPATAKFIPSENIIIGNTVMYGATGGALFAAGQAGERFCVRNSGGQAVVEGCGDHGCEYMTNGLAIIIGPTGKNFGAGMTGGVAYVLDEDGSFPERYNKEIVKLSRMKPEDVAIVQSLIYKHLELTESAKAKALLADWKTFQDKFWKVASEPAEVKATVSEAKSVGEAIIATTPPPSGKS